MIICSRRLLTVFLFALAIFLFSPKVVFAVQPPTLESPPNGGSTSDTSPTLSWSWSGSCYSGGSCFRVQVDDQGDFNSLEKDNYTSNTYYTPNLSIGSWYWRVKAKDNEGTWSDWSSRNFSIVEGESNSPTPSPSSALSPSPISLPTSTPTQTQTATGTYKINEVKNGDGEVLSSVKIYVDGVYTHHYAPEMITFCEGCKCDTYVDCGFGEHTIKLEKNGYEAWSQTKIFNTGDIYEVSPVMNPTGSSSNSNSSSNTSIPAKSTSLAGASATQKKSVDQDSLQNLPGEILGGQETTESGEATNSSDFLATLSASPTPAKGNRGGWQKNIGKILLILGGTSLLASSTILVWKKREFISSVFGRQ